MMADGRGGSRQKLGQHFLADGSVIQAIIDAVEIEPDDHVMEIGPGRGAITDGLRSAAKTLTLIEADSYLAEKLTGKLPDVKVIEGRGEQIDISSLGSCFKLASNLPYYASVAIFQNITLHKGVIARMVLMFQKEVANRIAAEAGSRAYGSLSLFSGYHWKIEKLMVVPPEAFSPPPKVDSAILVFTPRLKPPVDCNEQKLFKLIRMAFTQKRKTLRNNLKSAYTAESIQNALQTAGLKENERAEQITLQQFAEMMPLLKTN